jgi:hypothetical protein
MQDNNLNKIVITVTKPLENAIKKVQDLKTIKFN